MKRTLTLLGLSLMLSAAPLFAQKPMDSANEKAVKITSGPSITNITGSSATINWTTNSAGTRLRSFTAVPCASVARAPRWY